MLYKTRLKESEVTSEKYYLNRRHFLATLAGGVALSILPPALRSEGKKGGGFADQIKKTDYGKNLKSHTYKQITNYNKFLRIWLR